LQHRYNLLFNYNSERSDKFAYNGRTLIPCEKAFITFIRERIYVQLKRCEKAVDMYCILSRLSHNLKHYN